KLSACNAKNTSNKRLNSEHVDYCPSVFFNRFVAIRERKSAEAEKNFTLKKIKTYLNGNLFSRKKSGHSSRKSRNSVKMDEEAMWKGFYEKLQEAKSNPPTEHEAQIQDLDGRFFEKFGSLLRQKSEYAEEKITTTPLAPLPNDECSAADVDTDCQLNTIEENENDSGTDTLQDTDSEHEEHDQAKKNEEIFTDLVGLNIEELYEEVLYEILHNVGCEVENETCPEALFQYLQDAFKIVNERHDEIMRSAESKEAPEIRLNVEVIEAKELQPKDPNGSSDPFVTLYIASSQTHRYNTSVKSSTLNPSWEEHFSLPITETPNDENLIVEVDFDPAETVSEKMTKFFDVKGVKGFKKLMKEIAVTASTGKHDNELIGRCNIPLRTIPASGLVMWFSLDKKNKLKRQGLIKIRLAFSAEKNNRVAVQEHKNLLRILLMHELDSSKVAPYWWSGKFSIQGEAVIAQHSAQSGLSAIDCVFAQWSVYTTIHNDHPLAFNLFESLLDKLIRPIQSLSISEDEVKHFWEGTTKLLPSCFSVIRKLRKKTATDKNCVKILTDVLSILSKVAMLEPPEGTDLFPKNVYGWVTRQSDGPSWDIHGTLQDAVSSGARDWFVHISDNNTTGSNDSDEDKLQNVIKIIQLVRSDLQRAIEHYDKLFQQKMHFPYARTCYVYYEEKLSEYIEPIINDVCKNLKRLSLPDDRYQPLPEHEEVNMGTTLFELYLVLKRFAVLGTALSPIATEFKINQYHQWFTPGVTHWLDISVYKALIRIEKAIELDQLIPVDETVKYSSSAVDTLAIFYQIKIFWQQLDWPDAEGSYMFVGKIVDDICRCCVFYADRMSTRVEGLGNVQNVYENKFEVTREWCLAINNIDYIRQSLSPFVKELRVDEIISKLSDYRSAMEAERCSDTLKNVIANALDTETNKIVELIEVVARKMSPPMRRFLTEGAELLHQDSNSMDRIMMYLEDSLQTLNAELNEVNFERILDAIWTELACILKELVQNNIDKRRPPLFFANLRDTLQLMVKSFKGTQTNKDKVSTDKETLEEIFTLLELHGYETSDLIHQYYIERAKQQENISDSRYGQLTVRCWFEDNNLLIDVMNARNLTPMDSNGSCDPFVRIQLIPEEKFGNVTKIKTKAHDKTLFPLFDEKFCIPLTPDQKAMHNAVVMFSVKDKDLFGYSNQYIAECYLVFQNIPDDSSDQIHLKLSRPTCSSSECIHALEYRQGDKQAKDFIKKLRQKTNSTK
ncbi:Protein unc-13 like 4B, partial [Pseudolycoriella hygida]